METLNQNYATFGSFEIQKNMTYFHNGQPSTNSYIYNFFPLHYDDYIEIEFKGRFEKKIS